MLDKDIEIRKAEEAKQKAALEELKVVTDKLIQYMGLSDSLKTEMFSDEYCDPELRIGDMGCSILSGPVKQKTILGEKDVDGFIVGHIEVYPGVYRYADGSGEPPSEEFIEDAEVHRPIDAAINGIRSAVNMLLGSAEEAYNEEQMYKDFSEEEDRF